MKDDLNNEQIITSQHRCNSWCCPICGEKKGRYLRKILHQKKEDVFVIPKMFTFTVNPNLFESPQKAYEFVRDGKFIPRMFRYLNITRWVCVFECQKNGFPHWHCIADISTCKSAWIKKEGENLIVKYENPNDKSYHFIKNFVDLKKLQKLWRKWGIGEQLEFSRKKGYKSIKHAFNYITKYLIKNPKNGFPQWLLLEKRVKFVTASRAVGSLYGAVSNDSVENIEDDEEKEKRETREIFIRLASCGNKTDFIIEDEGKKKYIGCINMPLEVMLKLRPDDFIKKRVLDEEKNKFYYVTYLKRGCFNLWRSMTEYEETNMISNKIFDDRINEMGLTGIVENF